MSDMSNADFLSFVNHAKQDAIQNNTDWMTSNVRNLDYYLSNPNGYEEEGHSSVTSSDVHDVVESDMPSLVRVFLGSKEIMEFAPLTPNDAATQEANEKTKMVHWVINNQPNSFKIQHDWLKNIEIQRVGMLHYRWDQSKTTQIKEYSGLDVDELTLILSNVMQTVDQDKSMELEVITNKENKNGEWELKFKIIRTIKSVVLENIPSEEQLISTHAVSKDAATLIGHQRLISRGDLVAQGFDEEKLKLVPAASELQNATRLKRTRFESGLERSSSTNSISHWASQKVAVYNLYVLIDFDGDGILERRHVIQIGNEIFHNEQFDHVPYAITSAILMPDTIAGRSRADITAETQDVKTTLLRQTLDNGYRVNSGRVVINDEMTNMDDVLVDRISGVIRTQGDPLSAVAVLQTPYIGDKSLQLIQYMDSARAQSTGSLMANQGLDSDTLYKETATRFNGVEREGAAKVELVARVIGEVGYRDLFEGIAWILSRFQNTKQEIEVLGKPMTIDPTNWISDHRLESKVGLAAGADAETQSSLGVLLTIHDKLKASGSLLTDSDKEFNIIEELTQSMGFKRVGRFFNNPNIQEETLLPQLEQTMAQNEQLMTMVDQLKSNPLVEPEMIKAEASLLKEQNKNQIEVAKLAQDQQQFESQQNSDLRKQLLDLEEKYTELQLQHNTDIEGKGADETNQLKP